MADLVFKEADIQRKELLRVPFPQHIPRIGDRIHFCTSNMGREVSNVRWIYFADGTLDHISVEVTP